MISGEHPSAGLYSDEADREDPAQVARHLILVGRGHFHSVIVWHKCIRRYSTRHKKSNKATS